MALVALAERSVVPGQAGAYLAALRAFSQTLAFGDGRGEVLAVVDDADADRVLVLGRWASRVALDRLAPRLAAGLVAEAASHLSPGSAAPRWYRIEREIERIAVRPGYAVAQHYAVAPQRWTSFERAVGAEMHRLVGLPGVVAQALLVELDDPTRVVVLRLFTGPDASVDADRLAADGQSAGPSLGALARFAGRPDVLWEAPLRVGA